MKKATALALALLLLALAACGGGGGEKDQVVGKWALSGLSAGGMDFSEQVFMFDLSLAFNADGSGYLVSEGERIYFTWQDSFFDDGEQICYYLVDGDTLSLDREGMTFRFTRS